MDTETYVNLSLSFLSYELRITIPLFSEEFGNFSISFVLQSCGFFKKVDENTFTDVISEITIGRENIKSGEFLYDFGRDKIYISRGDILEELKKLEDEKNLESKISCFTCDVDMYFGSIPRNFKPSETCEVLDQVNSIVTQKIK